MDGTVLPVHPMKAYGGITPLIHLSTRCSSAVSVMSRLLYAREEPPVATEQEAGQTPEPV
jgi:hypothetical protein